MQVDQEAAQATRPAEPSISPTGRVVAAAALVLVGALAWSFHSSFAYLMRRWEDSNYSHGWLIIPIAAAILWQRRDRLAGVEVKPAWWGLAPLAALLALRAYLYEKNEQWMEAALIPAVVGAAVLTVGGWRVFRWALPAVVYLGFILPLPNSLDDKLAAPLQTVATLGSVEVLQILRTPVLADGNVIYIGGQHVEVAEACRGLSMLLSFAALITAMMILFRRPLAVQIVLAASIIPIALFCNIIRISVTAIAYWYYDKEMHSVHDWAGLAMMVMAFALVSLELKIMSWIVIEDQPINSGTPLIRPAYTANPGPR